MCRTSTTRRSKPLTLNGGTLLTSTGTSTFAGAVTLGAAGSTVDVSGTQLTLSGVIGGGNELTKASGGILILSGNNTYTGATNINAGTLAVTANNALGTNAAGTTVASGATLDLRNVLYTTSEGLTLDGGTLLASAGTSSYAGGVTLSSDSQIAVTGSALTVSGSIQGGGGLDVTGGGSLTLAGAIGNTTALAYFTSDATTTLAVNGGSVMTTGDQSYGGATTFGATTTLSSTGGNIGATGAVVATAGALTLNAGGDVAFNNASNNFGTVQVIAGGDASLVDTNAITLGTSFAGTLFARTLNGGNLTLGGNVAASGSGESIVLVAGGNFLNPGSRTLSPGAGRWLVYSDDPSLDNRGGLVPNFKHYGLSYSGGAYGGPGAGNGFIYSFNSSTVPTITPSLTGATSKVYDANPSASLVAANFVTSGAIDGDTVTLDNPVAGSYVDKNVGTGKSVSTTVSISSASNGAVAVYGYTLVSTTASGNIGEITPAALTITAQSNTKTYDAGTSSATTPTVTGLQGTDAVTGLAQVYADPNFGLGNKTLSVVPGYTVVDGNAGANYTISTVNNTTGTINKAGLTITALTDTKTYDANTSSAPTPTVTGLQGSDSVTGLAQVYADPNFGLGNKTLTVVPGYTVVDGNAGANYTISTVNNTTGTINKAGLTITALTDTKTYDANTSSAPTPTVTGLQGSDSVTGLAQVYADPNFGLGNKTLTVSGYTVVDGNGGANYTVSTANNTTGTINKAGLTITALTDTKTYDATTSSAPTPTVTGLQGADAVTGLAQVYADPNFGLGNKTLSVVPGYTVVDGNAGANYTVSTVNNTTGTINKAGLTITAADRHQDLRRQYELGADPDGDGAAGLGQRHRPRAGLRGPELRPRQQDAHGGARLHRGRWQRGRQLHHQHGQQHDRHDQQGRADRDGADPDPGLRRHGGLERRRRS